MNNEQIIIGQILTDPKVFYSSKLKCEHFSDPLCRRAFAALSDLFNAGITPDLLAVVEHSNGEISPVWWAERTNIPSSANYEFYETKVVEAYRLRELDSLKNYITDWLKDSDSSEVVQNLEHRLLEITSLTEKDRVYKAGELSMEFIKNLEERYKGGVLPGISTGISRLDEFTGGLQPRLKYEIGGRPSDGKSALMVTLACNIGVRSGIPCGILSLESSKEEIYSRMIANIGSIDSQAIQTGMIGNARHFKSISDANAKVYDSPVYIYDVPNMSLSEVKIQARRMVRQYGVKVIFIDYEQLIKIPGVHEIYPRVTECSTAIKDLARELNIPIVALAQLRRKDDNRRPLMSDFLGSGQIEQDADGGILIYHKRDSDTHEIKNSYLCVEKMRDGRTGDIPVVFNMPYVRFVAAARNYEFEEQ